MQYQDRKVAVYFVSLIQWENENKVNIRITKQSQMCVICKISTNYILWNMYRKNDHNVLNSKRTSKPYIEQKTSILV